MKSNRMNSNSLEEFIEYTSNEEKNLKMSTCNQLELPSPEYSPTMFQNFSSNNNLHNYQITLELGRAHGINKREKKTTKKKEHIGKNLMNRTSLK